MPDFQLPERNEDSGFAAMRWSHACLRVPDYATAMRWFREMLDFRLVIEWPGPMGVKMAYLAAPNDDRCVIEIVGDGAPPSPVPPTTDLFASFGRGGYHHICFTVPDVAAMLGELERRGVPPVAPPFEVPEIGRKIGFVQDPFGNLIEFEEKLA